MRGWVVGMLAAATVVSAAQKAEPRADVRATIDQIIQEARTANKAQKELLAKLEEGKATREFYMERVSITDKSVKTIHVLIDKLDENYDALSESQQSTLRESWDIAKLLTAFVDNLKEAGTQLNSKEQQEEAKVNAQCASRRAVMLEDTLSKMQESTPTRSSRQPS